MTNYREIIRLTGSRISQCDIMASCVVRQKTVDMVQKLAGEFMLSSHFSESLTDMEQPKLMLFKGNKVLPDKYTFYYV